MASLIAMATACY